ncbi:DNA-binding response regulator [Xenophilus aerolatus]|nr:DNA-binding response regulator [Xenophilus aerolatus]
MRIAVLDDEPAQLSHAIQAITQHWAPADQKLECLPFGSGDALRRQLRYDTFDLLVLDWNVPDLDGAEILRWLRQHRVDEVPVLMLSSRSSEKDVADALGMGADDYVIKPFRAVELAARVRRLLMRKLAGQSTGLESFGDWLFNHHTMEATYDNPGCSDHALRCTLSEREFRLALGLFRNAGKLISRTHLLDSLGYSVADMTTRLLDNHIYRLRAKLGLSHERGVQLQTVYGHGYRLQLLPRATQDPDGE